MALFPTWADSVQARSVTPVAVAEARFTDFASLRRSVNAADTVARDFVVFNANSFRILAGLHDILGKLYVRHVFTPAEYDRWSGRLKQGLAAALGGQPVLSGVLRGKRAINVRQAKALVQRFGVSPAVFI